ncbi:hypothetical protein JVT61DRAFT_7852 [Boletus reticuloceps]|uniref:Uncharacterized protein n=1 Tax=Boletus reticuloceps TaxID=495285 RepID=A0A8I2YIH0_9AGAM|nr:hypothetical protein JVT61DRAFT_7852 [Boletus reticuloceps]
MQIPQEIRTQRAHLQLSASKSDKSFHFSPFMILDHHTISPIYYHPSSAPATSTMTWSPVEQPQMTPSDNPTNYHLESDAHPYETPRAFDSEESNDGDSGPVLSIYQDDEAFPTVPSPRSAMEAYLLLEAARADCCIFSTHKSLALQIVHRNTLVLQYNHMTLEKAQNDLRAADQFIGHV